MRYAMSWCLLGAGAVVLCGATADAIACGGAMLEDYDPSVLLVAQKLRVREADARLRERDYGAAVNFARMVSSSADSGYERAQRVIARAIARTDGKMSSTGGEEGDPALNLAWATLMLETMAEETAGDPRVLTDLGEVLSRQPAHFDRASRVLEDLAARDLITSAEGWAALAALRGSGPGRDEAQRRCKLMASMPVETCGEGLSLEHAGIAGTPSEVTKTQPNGQDPAS